MLVLSKHFKLQQKSEEGADSGWLNALYLVFDADDVLRAKLHSQWHEQNHHWSYYQLQLCCGNAELKSWCNQRLLNGKFKLHLVEEMRRDPVCKLISKLFQVMNQCCKMQSQQTWPNVTVSFRSFKTDSLAVKEQFPEQGNVCLNILLFQACVDNFLLNVEDLIGETKATIPCK